MKSDTLSIRFDFARESPLMPAVENLRADAIVGDLTARGFEFLELRDIPKQPSIPGNASDVHVRLCVENDAMYLAESYAILEEIVGLEIPHADHDTYLADGVLAVQAEIINENVFLRIIHCPGLRKSSTSTSDFWVPLLDYVNTWRRLAAAFQTGTPAP